MDNDPDDKFIFSIASSTGLWPDMEKRAYPELSVFFPAGHECRQENYGQGEG